MTGAPDQLVFGPAHHNDVLHSHKHLIAPPPPLADGSHMHPHYHPGEQHSHAHPHRHPAGMSEGDGRMEA